MSGGYYTLSKSPDILGFAGESLVYSLCSILEHSTPRSIFYRDALPRSFALRLRETRVAHRTHIARTSHAHRTHIARTSHAHRTHIARTSHARPAHVPRTSRARPAHVPRTHGTPEPKMWRTRFNKSRVSDHPNNHLHPCDQQSFSKKSGTAFRNQIEDLRRRASGPGPWSPSPSSRRVFGRNSYYWSFDVGLRLRVRNGKGLGSGGDKKPFLAPNPSGWIRGLAFLNQNANS